MKRAIFAEVRNPSDSDVSGKRLLVAVALILIGSKEMVIAADPTEGPETEPVDYSIVVTGNELLSGIYADGHTHFLTRTLQPLGLRCVGSVCVNDHASDIKQALAFCQKRSNLIIVTGGLGPTDNDITRDVLADYTGVALREHPDVLARMERRLRTSRDQLRSNLRRQTRVPVQGTYLDNPTGSAVGLVFDYEGKVIVALPGPPHELQPMVRDELTSLLARRFGTRLAGVSLTVRFVGLGQSQIDQTMKDHIPLPARVILSSQFQGGRVDFTFSLPGDDPEDRALLERLRKDLHKWLGDWIYADDASVTLEQCVAQRLAADGHTLVLVEVGSGGSVAAGFDETKAVRDVLAGAYVAPSEQKLRHMLGISEDQWPATTGEQSVRLLARVASEHAISGWVVAIGESQKEPKSGRLYVNVAFKRPDDRIETEKISISGSGTTSRARLTTRLLDKLRRQMR